jgi:GNAT superfamily N-acetyltransferase
MAIKDPEPLSRDHDVGPFSSGKPALDNWLKTRAVSNQEKGFTAVTVVHDAGRVVGYYGLAPTALAPAILPRPVRTGQPPDPVPCFLLGQLAVDRAWAGKGLGSALLVHALQRCADAYDLVAGRAVAVNAVDGDAAGFWVRHDFVALPDNPLVLVRKLDDIIASLKKAGLR